MRDGRPRDGYRSAGRRRSPSSPATVPRCLAFESFWRRNSKVVSNACLKVTVALAGHVLAIACCTPDVDRLFARVIEADQRVAAEALAVASAGDRHAQHPVARAAGLHHQTQAAAILVHTLRQPVEVLGPQATFRPHPSHYALPMPYRVQNSVVLRRTAANKIGSQGLAIICVFAV